jgi:hypothetical protein
MPGGYVSGAIPQSFDCWPIVLSMRVEVFRRSDRAEFLDFLADKGVEYVAVPVDMARAAAPLLGALRGRPQRTGGVLVFPAPERPRRPELPSGCRS